MYLRYTGIPSNGHKMPDRKRLGKNLAYIAYIASSSLSQSAETNTPKVIPQIPWRMVRLTTQKMGPLAGN